MQPLGSVVLTSVLLVITFYPAFSSGFVSGNSHLSDAEVLKKLFRIFFIKFGSQEFLRWKDRYGYTALHHAIISHNAMHVQVLLEVFKDLEVCYPENNPALHLAVKHGQVCVYVMG